MVNISENNIPWCSKKSLNEPTHNEECEVGREGSHCTDHLYGDQVHQNDDLATIVVRHKPGQVAAEDVAHVQNGCRENLDEIRLTAHVKVG